MFIDGKILVGKDKNKESFILLDKVNRHGLITGASGSGKTITLKVIAESFSDAGIPVFLADVKGDIAGTCLPGKNNDKIQERLDKINVRNFNFKEFPVCFWDVYGKRGHSIRTTVKSVGPVILSRMLGLTDAQSGILTMAFKIAEEKGLDLIDLDDLKILLTYMGEHRKDYINHYGNIATQSIGSIQRGLLQLESQGGNSFFGEPSLDIYDFIQNNSDGNGFINIMDCVELFKNPELYSCFLLWILTTLFHTLPEVGDLEKPKIVFFFDEAHLLFDDMPNYMLKEVTQIVKLIRSKGIGLFFVSQTPLDIPDSISSQLGNRIQHTLRAYTPAEDKIIKSAASSFRVNPQFDTETAIRNLGTGEALVSFQNEKGEPTIVEKVTILPPQSAMNTIDDDTRAMVINRSLFKGKYDTSINNDSAYEKISSIMNEEKQKKEEETKRKEEEKLIKLKEKEEEKLAKEKEKKKRSSVEYKLGKKVFNKTTDKILNKFLNTLVKKIFK